MPRPSLCGTSKERLELHNVMVVSPMSAACCAPALGETHRAPLAIVDKRRERARFGSHNIIGDVPEKVAFSLIDIVDFGGTCGKAADALLNEGAQEV